MKWTKVSIATRSEETDIVSDLLLSCGISGVEIVDPREFDGFLLQDKKSWDYVDASLLEKQRLGSAYIIFYLAHGEDGSRALEEIKAQLLSHVPMLTLAFSVEHVNDEDWLDEWKKHFAPIRAGKVGIVPAWDRQALSPPAEIVFTLDPGSAFGTGQHATTFLCVEALQERLTKGQALLDAGCGSGILAVIGLLLGASDVVACDIDPSAITATHHHVALNGVDSACLQVLHGNIITDAHMADALHGRSFDVIAANIVADVIIPLLPTVAQLLAPNGFFITSGIIDDRAEEVLIAMQANGLRVISNKALEGWHCLVCVHA
ncbi:MAG: 50S ribosomal protein L11 methyltransferase [Defluviitaleaceae bacterium]|nr:50S ribosomal protein L11 methyltransferase [Defluviitaleaceae bacterium]MCL2273324.1 50S ribosomal protein L11 methyltransferase [Defluviitaleaceae bacterium]